MKRVIQSSADTQNPAYKNYKVVAWDDYYESNAHYFITYQEALQFGNRVFNGQCDIKEI